MLAIQNNTPKLVKRKTFQFSKFERTFGFVANTLKMEEVCEHFTKPKFLTSWALKQLLWQHHESQIKVLQHLTPFVVDTTALTLCGPMGENIFGQLVHSTHHSAIDYTTHGETITISIFLSYYCQNSHLNFHSMSQGTLKWFHKSFI